MYCDPQRHVRPFFGSSSSTTTVEVEERSRLHLLDLEQELTTSSVVKTFLESHSQEYLHQALLPFYREVLSRLGVALEDLYFEDVELVKKVVYYIEIHSLD